jgi:hypothetical protein
METISTASISAYRNYYPDLKKKKKEIFKLLNKMVQIYINS